MWPALLLPVLILVGTLGLERLETGLLTGTRRVGHGLLRPAGGGESPLWTVVPPPRGEAAKAGAAPVRRSA
ncbi:MAG TPA: hypothetical protein VFG87_03175 [Amycolatopsis sp.]|nr:hypothetical protein [Amycolatopsis sp.]